jgi:OHCU decarboxylase
VDRRRVEDELTAGPVDLDALNDLGSDGFTAVLGLIFEHSPWIARAAYGGRPFTSVAALHAAMVSVVTNAAPDQQLRLLRAHPELARPGRLTEASASEQSGIGLDRMATDEAESFDSLNAAYRARFGFPFIIAVRGQRDRTAILAALSKRISHSPEQEMATALAEVAKIARFRLDDLITPPADAS